jgi:hypothetical protein
LSYRLMPLFTRGISGPHVEFAYEIGGRIQYVLGFKDQATSMGFGTLPAKEMPVVMAAVKKTMAEFERGLKEEIAWINELERTGHVKAPA